MNNSDPVAEIRAKKGNLPDAYDPKYVESFWYDWWVNEGFFKPDYNKTSISETNSKGKFVIVIPPPNVTGTLHLGHALTNSIEDALVRWNRMKGKTTLWVPGCDHAGIATQVVVERKLWREEKKSRHDLGREKFIEKVWDWKKEKGDFIYLQLRKLGSSLDWSRAAFTMDPKLSKAVNEAFIRLYDNGTIYRSSRLVNWSCSLKSAISDIEVDKKEITGRTYLQIPGYQKPIEFGVLVYFAYQLEDNTDAKLIVATTRIETMLGDVAIAVHPKDERYTHLHGKFVVHPFVKDRKLPIICDEFVDRNFGSGAVKITPAHDPNDYEVGKRHGLPFITVIDDNGNMKENCSQFSGMKRFECRFAVLEELKKLNLYVETKNNPMTIPLCSRSKDVIEPLIKPQWYVKCDDMAKRAMSSVASGELKIVPDQHVKIWNHWMNNIRDWCISRQLWWGHRIPAFFVRFKRSSPKQFNEDDLWVAAHDYNDALQKACSKFDLDENDIELVQDDDVLDTWFSSGLFPFSVFGWPDSNLDLKTFYPTSLLETGHDILFFWVARMVFLGEKLLGQLPFKHVFLHPIVRDAHGRKMSKSLGNVIDPLDVIKGISLEDLHNKLREGNLDERELKKAIDGQKKDFKNGIQECGTDALRFALCAMCQGRDLNLDIFRVLGYRHFCNKIWNAVKFALIYFKDDFEIPPNICQESQLLGTESIMDLWILSRISNATQLCNTNFESFDFVEVTTTIYNFWLYELCDVYLECLKPIFQTKNNDQEQCAAKFTLYRCLNIGLRLLSPFMPFITEELYHLLPKIDMYSYRSICVAPYPDTEIHCWRNTNLEKSFDLVSKIAKTIRSTRASYNIINKHKTEAFVNCLDSDTLDIVQKFIPYLKTLSYCSVIEINDGKRHFGCAVLTVSDKCEVQLQLRGLIDPEKETVKLLKKLQLLDKQKQKLEADATKSDYEVKVPENVRVANIEKLVQIDTETVRIQEALSYLKDV